MIKTEYKSVQFIQEHLDMWKKKGMPGEFLDSIISAGNGNYELDVESALTCNLDLFGSAYAQKDFLTQLIALCKKYKLQYGRVKPELRKKSSEFVEKIYDDMFKNMPARVDGDKEEGLACADATYQIHKVENKEELYAEIRESLRPGDSRLSLTPRTIELLLSLARDGLSLQRIEEITCLGEKSVRRYYSALQNYNIVSVTGGRVRGIKEFNVWVNYNKVVFSDGFNVGEKYVTELWN